MRKTIMSMAVVAIAVMGAAASSASAAPTTTCENSGTIKLSPGLTATPQIQNVTVKGILSNCTGEESAVTNGKYIAHLKTTEAVSCAALSSAAADEGKIVLKATPKGEGNSQGSFSMPVSELPTTIGGLLEEGGTFSGQTVSGSVQEAYEGGATCGVAEGKKKAKKVNKGTFTGSMTIS
jgi:hypothetical protein